MAGYNLGMDCVFCQVGEEEAVLRGDGCYARYDIYPASPGHLLIIPDRHVAAYFDCTLAEKRALWDLVEQGKALLDRERSPDGYNIGINIGASAGQTVHHVHIHLIPRYTGDTQDPRGGVRGAVPGKRRY